MLSSSTPLSSSPLGAPSQWAWGRKDQETWCVNIFLRAGFCCGECTWWSFGSAVGMMTQSVGLASVFRGSTSWNSHLYPCWQLEGHLEVPQGPPCSNLAILSDTLMPQGRPPSWQYPDLPHLSQHPARASMHQDTHLVCSVGTLCTCKGRPSCGNAQHSVWWGLPTHCCAVFFAGKALPTDGASRLVHPLPWQLPHVYSDAPPCLVHGVHVLLGNWCLSLAFGFRFWCAEEGHPWHRGGCWLSVHLVSILSCLASYGHGHSLVRG